MYLFGCIPRKLYSAVTTYTSIQIIINNELYIDGSKLSACEVVNNLETEE